MARFKLGVCQMPITGDKSVNLAQAREMVLQAADSGCAIAVLPEMFNCPYSHKYFVRFAETAPDGETIQTLSNTAREAGVTIVGGSIPERDGERVYNTSFIFGPDGALLGRQRKIHLFDVELETLSFRESDTLSPGEETNPVLTPVATIGVAICYDVRFPELIRSLSLKGAQVVVIPAAFNMITGPAHWELLLRARAVDNQVYTVGASPARDPRATYVYYGHSLVVNPWAEAIAAADEKPGVIVADIDLDFITKVRNELPLLKNRRTDIVSLNIMQENY
ncbi:MAG: carbon-nitrogen hydrolase family protein [Eubacteriales bacterium]|nr:carbon-nitrogen hydrolase family protein [Clostridia bacterium]MDZ4042704.1 carbon-nitrogen hydrolase family protein [Eubacteriales bacterium]MDZ7610645.1 carbon-nitrogen hydrolase family protein [Eubacteriales bacterium]